MREVEVKLSTMHLGGRKRVLYYTILKLVFNTRNLCKLILYFYGEKYGIPENVARFLKKCLSYS